MMKKKYYYTDGKDSFGPFTIEELKANKVTRDIKVWYEGLQEWTDVWKLPEVDEIMQKEKICKVVDRKINKTIWTFTLCVIISLVVVLLSFMDGEDRMRDTIRENSYTDESVDFQMYVDKFYRDANFYGIYPQKPNEMIIKFSRLDEHKDLLYYHGLSMGYGDDDRIEIYINPSTWESFNKAKRYLLMYHELAHDVLNVDDLSESEINKGKLMYPALSEYEHVTMDEFIEMSYELFEEIAE